MADPTTVARRLMGWKPIQQAHPPARAPIEAIVEHYHKDHGLNPRTVRGYMGDDNFYFEDGGELSHNWNIIEWRLL
jgi:hypothetical protein